MPRLLRPHIPLEVRCRVALGQIGWSRHLHDIKIEQHRKLDGGLGGYLRYLLGCLAPALGCEVVDLRLDHDPALENREKVFKRGAHVGYKPDANDPEYLFYRTATDHDIKTRVRGDGAQFADNVIAKRERKRLRKKAGGKPRNKIPARANPWPPRGRRKFGR